MAFKLGDYIKHKEYPKSEIPILLVDRWHMGVVNAQAENFQYSSKEEHDAYWGER